MSIVSDKWTLPEIRDDEDRLNDLRGDLYSRCLRITGGDHSLSEDITQHVLTKACETEEVFLGYESFKKWSNVCAKNKFLDHVRITYRQNSENTYRGRKASGRLRQARVEEIGVDDVLDRRIVAALLAIPILHKLIITNYAEDKTYEEIASEIHITHGQVRSKIHHTRQMLRPKLSKVYEEYFGKPYITSK